MKHRYHQPHSQLAAYIRTTLVIEGFADADSNTLPLLTNGMPTLFYRSEKDQAGKEYIINLTLIGLNNIPADYWTVNEQTTIVAYFFKPFALTSLFNISAKTLKENPIELRNINSHTFKALEVQLSNAHPMSKKIEALNDFLLAQLKVNLNDCETIQYATNKIMLNPSPEVLTELLLELNLTTRTFQRMFKKFVGITPTQYRRICQFQASFGQLRSKNFNKLSDIAFDSGFTDQSHFIRSFKEFTQTTPNHYLQRGLSDNDK